MKKAIHFLIPAVFALLACLPAARAATYSFTDNLSETQNWSGGTSAGWNIAPLSNSASTLTFTGSLPINAAQISNNDLPGNFVLNALNFNDVGPASGVASLTIQSGTLEFANNGATGPTITTAPTGTVKPTLTIASNIQLDNNLTLLPGSTLTLSGTISGVGGLVMNKLNLTTVVTNANTYTGPTNDPQGLLTLSGSGSLLSTSSITVGGVSGATFALDYTGAAANASVHRFNTSATVTVQGNASLNFLGNATTATSDSIGTLSLGVGNGFIGLTTGTGVMKITAAAFSRGSNNGTGIIRGTALGTMGSATTANQLILTNAAGVGTQVGTANPSNNLATNDTTKNLQIVPYLVGDNNYSIGGGNTFVTYDSVLGFRLLSTTNEFNDYGTAGTGDNASNITAATTNAATKTINSLLTSKDLTGVGGGSNVLTVSSGAILSTAATTISGFGGITLGNNEGVITTALTSSTTAINSPITINNGSGNGGALTKTGLGTLLLGAPNNYTGVTTINQGVLQVGNGGDLGNTSGIVLASGLNPGLLVFNTTTAINLPSASVTGFNSQGTVTRAATSTGALTLGSVNGIATFTDNSTNGASAPTTFNQVGTGNTIGTLNGASGSVVTFASNDGTASTTINSSNGDLNTPGQLVKVTNGSLTLSTSGAGAYTTSDIEVDGGALVFSGNEFGAASGTLTIKGGAVSCAATFRTNYGVSANNAVLTINESGGLFSVPALNVGGGAYTGCTSTYNLSGGILSGSTGLNIGADVAGTNTSTFNLSGGKLLAGAIAGTNGAGAKQAFIWTGGTLAASTYTATNLTSGSGVGVVTGVTNTLTNAGGILAPGDMGSGGLFAVTGNYFVTSPNATYAVEIGGSNAATSAFTAGTSGANFYDKTTVSGSTALGGRLNFNVINSFAPVTGTNYSILVGSASGVTGSFTNQVTATSGNSRVVGADGLSSFLVAINNTAATATTGGVAGVTARTLALGGYQAANTYNAASGGTWDAANASSWTNLDPGATATPATQASSAIAQFADGASTGSLANAVSLNSTRNIQGVQFASTTAGHNYTIAGSGTMILDNTSNSAAATIADSSVSGNVNAINVPITLKSNLALSVTNAANVLSIGGAIGETAAGSTLTKTGSGTAILAGMNTYTGATVVSAGKLLVTGSLNGTTTVNGGTLGGNGSTLGITVNSGGTLAAGLDAANTTAGTITANGNVSFASGGAHLAIRLGETTATDGDQVATAAGSALAVSLSGADLQLTLGTAFDGAPAVDTLYLIVNNANSGSSFSGQFAQGSTVTVGTTVFTVLYGANYDASGAFVARTGGNDVALLLAVPEPGTWAMLVGGLGMLITTQRIRRRSAR